MTTKGRPLWNPLSFFNLFGNRKISSYEETTQMSVYFQKMEEGAISISILHVKFASITFCIIYYN